MVEDRTMSFLRSGGYACSPEIDSICVCGLRYLDMYKLKHGVNCDVELF